MEFVLGTRLVFVSDFRNAAGEPAAIDGRPTYESSDATVLAAPNDDGVSLTPYLTMETVVTGLGDTDVTVDGDGDLGAGGARVRHVRGTVRITGIQGGPAPEEAVTVSISAAAMA